MPDSLSSTDGAGRPRTWTIEVCDKHGPFRQTYCVDCGSLAYDRKVEVVEASALEALREALRRYHDEIRPWVAAGCPLGPLPRIAAADCAAADAALADRTPPDDSGLHGRVADVIRWMGDSSPEAIATHVLASLAAVAVEDGGKDLDEETRSARPVPAGEGADAGRRTR